VEDGPPERILILGWRRDLASLVLLLDRMVPPDSVVDLLSDLSMEQREASMARSGIKLDNLRNLGVVHHAGHYTSRHVLESLPNNYTSMIVVGDETLEHDSISSDGRCLATLLQIRDIQAVKQSGRISGAVEATGVEFGFDTDVVSSARKVPVAVEFRDPRTQDTVSYSSGISDISEFMLGDDLVAKVLAMVSLLYGSSRVSPLTAYAHMQ
jgi:hypothetical protein